MQKRYYAVYENHKDFLNNVIEDVVELATTAPKRHLRNNQASYLMVAEGYPASVVCRELGNNTNLVK